MARVFEIGGHRSGSATDTGDRDRNRTFAALDYATEEDARAAFLAYASANSLLTLGGLTLAEISPKQIEGHDTAWHVEATWAPFVSKTPTVASDTLAEATPEFNFSFAVSNEKVFVPIGSQSVFYRTGASPFTPVIDLIGDQGDGKPPAGVDLLVPEICFGEKRYLRQDYWTESVRNSFLRIIGRVNSTPFRSWDVGEVICAGISGAARGRDDLELQFLYRVRQNTTLAIPGFDDIDKTGWQYLWPRHKLKTQGTDQIVTNEIEFLVLADVFESTSFEDLE